MMIPRPSPPRRRHLVRVAVLAVAALACLPSLPLRAHCQQQAPPTSSDTAPAAAAAAVDPFTHSPPNGIPASGNVTDLNELTFAGRVADGRVWMVEFFTDWCRGCKRIAGHVSMLADALAQTRPDIAVGRVNCGQAEQFCDRVIGITRTPSFKVYFQGKKAIDYDAELYFFDMMQAFITDTAANLRGFSLPSSAPQPEAEEQEQDEDDDEYE